MDISARLTIRAIRARGLNVTLDRPIETASGVMKTTPLVLVDLETQEGITGHSYVRCYTPLALQPLVQLVANLEGLLTGLILEISEAACLNRLFGHYLFPPLQKESRR